MAGVADRIQTRAVAVPMLNKPSRLTRGGPPVWMLEELLTTPQHKALSLLRNFTQVIGLGQTLCDQLHSSTLFVICVVRLFFVLFCLLFVCKCVLPPGDNPIAVNKYIILYHIECNGPGLWQAWGGREIFTALGGET